VHQLVLNVLGQYILWCNYWSHSDFLLKLNLLCTNTFADTNKITNSYPCLLHRKHWNCTTVDICSSVSFHFYLLVYLLVTYNHFTGVKQGAVYTFMLLLVRYRLLTLLFQHWLGTTNSAPAVPLATTSTTVFTLLPPCHAVTTALQHFSTSCFMISSTLLYLLCTITASFIKFHGFSRVTWRCGVGYGIV
jgi:hypothetical protein